MNPMPLSIWKIILKVSINDNFYDLLYSAFLESKTTVDEEILLGVKCILAGKAHEIKDVKTIEIVESTCQG